MNSADKAEFVEHYLPVARRVINRMQRNTTQDNADDIESDGLYGLLSAAQTWNNDQDVRADGWVAVAVKRAIIDGIRRRIGRGNAADQAARDNVSYPARLDAPLTEDSNGSVGDLIADRTDSHGLTESIADLTAALDALPWRERHAIARVYFAGHTLLEVANDWGVTESRMSQICSGALRKMRAHMTEGN